MIFSFLFVVQLLGMVGCNASKPREEVTIKIPGFAPAIFGNTIVTGRGEFPSPVRIFERN